MSAWPRSPRLDEVGIDASDVAAQREQLKRLRKKDADEEAACLAGVVAFVVFGYLVGKVFR